MTRRAGSHGFTIVELLIIMVVIALIAVVLIPLFLSTLQASKQKRTMSDMNLVGKALLSWVSDQVGAAAAGAATTVPMTDYGAVLDQAVIEGMLVPNYLPNVPQFDAWGSQVEYRLNLVSEGGSRLMGIRSPGADLEYSTDEYMLGAFDPRDFNQDLVWVDGVFVRWPERQ